MVSRAERRTLNTPTSPVRGCPQSERQRIPLLSRECLHEVPQRCTKNDYKFCAISWPDRPWITLSTSRQDAVDYATEKQNALHYVLALGSLTLSIPDNEARYFLSMLG